MVALVDARLVPLGGLDREPDLEHAAVERARCPEADVLEHREHDLVLGQDLCDERLDAVGCRPLGELLEEAGSDAFALEVVCDGEGGLGRARVAEAHVVTDGNHALVARLAHDADQRSLLCPVGCDEGAHETITREGEAVETEEATPHGQRGEERDKGGDVFLDGRAQPQRGAVAEDHVDGQVGIVHEIDHVVKPVSAGAAAHPGLPRRPARETRRQRLTVRGGRGPTRRGSPSRADRRCRRSPSPGRSGRQPARPGTRSRTSGSRSAPCAFGGCTTWLIEGHGSRAGSGAGRV